IENRLTSAAGESYTYAPDNKRVWKKKPNGSEEFYFHGISGQKLGTYTWGGEVDTNVYFGSKLVGSRGGLVAGQDRLRSIGSYYPYGEEQQVTAQDRDKFATYYRDGTTGLDYAQNRYYANTLGRFLSPDAYSTTTGGYDSSNPQSWNRYAYAQGDPLNLYDPPGLMAARPPDDGSSGVLMAPPVLMAPLFAFPDGPGPVQVESDQNWGNTFQDVKNTAIERAKSFFDAAGKLAKKALERADCYGLFGTRADGTTAAQVFQGMSDG